ncbi:FAD-dependent thymidylate synthase [Thermogemmatispora sp.]|uniref:FAD-dependent thymidylate synthase n=1 Tax=Thermogemmatispora sp. TaxID=1968838 RepID=UPI001D44FEEE|nr:FAD-dependent thymidylate synthase [Thermogemmatispora sp.]MBX5448492.1 FAD-dependent thymidylate synthase [Thermogemmatispora sp.]
MTQRSAEELFHELQGQMEAGFAAIHVPVQHSPAGVPYLTAPGVVLLARPQTNLQGLAPFLEGFDPAYRFSEYVHDPTVLPDGAQLCKVAGQTCYLSFGPRRTLNAQAGRYFDHLKASRHGSVLEHATFSFFVYGVSRSLTHELIRHRAGFSYSQTSQRFVDGRTLRFVERPEYRQDEHLHRLFLQRIERAATEYAELSEYLLTRQQAGDPLLSAEARTDLRKRVQQCSRSLLPNETEAPLVVTANARAWRHVIEERTAPHAEIEIRELFVRIFVCLALVDPILFGDYTLERLPDGTYSVRTPYEKV